MVAACKCSCWVEGVWEGGDEEDTDAVKEEQYS